MALPNWYDRYIFRDQCMAENCMWIAERNPNIKVLVWAHNGHVSKSITDSDIRPMGSYLKEKYSSGYYVLGFGFNKGAFRARVDKESGIDVMTVPEVKSNLSTDFIFGQCKDENFFMDFKSTTGNQVVQDFLNRKLYSRYIGASYNAKKSENGKDIKKELINLYDGIVFFKQTIAASPQLKLWQQTKSL
ncbi:erythromycin esterase family protein [Arcticibacter eurypsychrophilus]|uniref:erythromycin esterase family protein n=1 Tax=Arcticibacter eurypsychrophilus TaxID=1434752 RepID=UPI001112F100|nr:erythromycin esterase family protein [Arcticibacter eurypsychrophilus]